MIVEVRFPMNCPLRYEDGEGIDEPNCQYLKDFVTVETYDKCLCKDYDKFPDHCPLLKDNVLIRKKR